MPPFIRSVSLPARYSRARCPPALFTSWIRIRLLSALPPKPEWDPNLKFNPEAHENGWYAYWESRSLFEPRPNPDKPPIRMLLPPPNVTGELHIGHALMIAIQDALARYYRMAGHPVEWAPGTDHAGIATQNVVEKMLQKKKGLTRESLGRRGFVREVEEWRHKYGGRILEQMRVLGASTTNSKEYYTQDEIRSKAVVGAFVKLWEEGLIYRDSRMVNWCIELQTAVSDIEVITQDIEKKTVIDGTYFGVLYKFAFPLVDGDGEIIVSTTRPETIPGDRAIAVHPDDERYKHLHYKYARHPLLPDITLPIVPDAELVDAEFGTGAVKITPAHDANDYAFWLRHSMSSPVPQPTSVTRRVDIPLVEVISKSGRMTPECGITSLVDKNRLKARNKIFYLLKAAEASRGEEDHKMALRLCERTGTVIEPLLQPQWYLKMKPLAEKMLKVAERDGLTFIPKNPPYDEMWHQWLSNIEDWCLSRQIWWGHRIPAYKVVDRKNDHISRWIAASSLSDAEGKLTDHERSCGYIVEQDTDVLDTWFSSGLLPLSNAGWTGQALSHEEIDAYPLTFIESGGDILFFWLARMAMLGTWFTDKLPFPEILLHSLVCDENGKKMSKSVGNVIDPLHIIKGRTLQELKAGLKAELQQAVVADKRKAKQELVTRTKELQKQFPTGFKRSGADSLRMALVDLTRRYTHISMELGQVDSFRRLAVKIENAFKYFHRMRGEQIVPPTIPATKDLKPHDLLLLHDLKALISTVNTAFHQRRLYDATTAIRTFAFESFGNLYLELVKKEIQLNSRNQRRREDVIGLLTLTWDILFRLLHPFMPYISETLYQALLPRTDAESIVIAPFPLPTDLPDITKQDYKEINMATQLIEVLREYGLVKIDGVSRAALEFEVLLPPSESKSAEYVEEMWETIKSMAKAPGPMIGVNYSSLGRSVKESSSEWAMVCRRDGSGWVVWERQKDQKIFVLWTPEDPK